MLQIATNGMYDTVACVLRVAQYMAVGVWFISENYFYASFFAILHICAAHTAIKPCIGYYPHAASRGALGTLVFLWKIKIRA